MTVLWKSFRRRTSHVIITSCVFLSFFVVYQATLIIRGGDFEITHNPDEDEGIYQRDLHQQLSKVLEVATVHREANATWNKRVLTNDVRMSEASRRFPDAIIIGVKKCGTRALLEILRMHPDVQACGPEVHYFDKFYDRGPEWYRSQMPASVPGEVIIEKTPSYYITRNTPGRIFNMSRDVKLLIVVRDPVTRALSDYAQAQRRRPDMPSFTDMALTDGGSSVNVSWAGVRLGMYVTFIRRWTTYFPLSQMLFVDGERLITEPEKEIALVQTFLALRPYIHQGHFVFNYTKGFPCFLKNLTYPPTPHCLGNKGSSHPTVDRRTLGMLRTFFTPLDRKLSNLVKRPLQWLPH